MPSWRGILGGDPLLCHHDLPPKTVSTRTVALATPGLGLAVGPSASEHLGNVGALGLTPVNPGGEDPLP